MNKHLVDLYKDQGYIFVKNLLTLEEVARIKEQLQSITPTITLQDGTPWGYGNLLEKFNFITQKEKLEILSELLGNNFSFNHLLVNNKSAFIGPPVEWHQELSLVNTYAAGYTPKDVDCFAQIYIALDEHVDINGCLRIFPKSHKKGLLEHTDIIGYNLNHKKQLTKNVLEKLDEELNLESIYMEPGDCLIFSHLLVHGSGANISNRDRKAVILQARKNYKPINKELFKEYSKFRVDFAVDFFKKKINNLTSKNMYTDFIGYDKKNKE